MIPELIERRQQAARDRGQTYLIHFGMWDGQEYLEFLDEARTDAELDAMKRYWRNEWGFNTLRVYDLYREESALHRARRIRNSRGKWESWRT